MDILVNNAGRGGPLARHIEYFELSKHPHFEGLFIESMGFER